MASPSKSNVYSFYKSSFWKFYFLSWNCLFFCYRAFRQDSSCRIWVSFNFQSFYIYGSCSQVARDMRLRSYSFLLFFLENALILEFLFVFEFTECILDRLNEVFVLLSPFLFLPSDSARTSTWSISSDSFSTPFGIRLSFSRCLTSWICYSIMPVLVLLSGSLWEAWNFRQVLVIVSACVKSGSFLLSSSRVIDWSREVRMWARMEDTVAYTARDININKIINTMRYTIVQPQNTLISVQEKPSH